MTPITRDPFQEQIQLLLSRRPIHKTDSAIVFWQKTLFPLKKSMFDIGNYLQHKRKKVYAILVIFYIKNNQLISSTRDHSRNNLALKRNIGRKA
jgi:hypothetical protein